MELSQQLEDKQVNVQHLQGNSDTLDGDIERLFENKQKVNHLGINIVPASHFDVLEMFFIIPQVYWIQII